MVHVGDYGRVSVTLLGQCGERSHWMNEHDEGGQAGADEGPCERSDDGQVDGKAGAESGGDAAGH
jgi:hypothetical protein